MILRNHHQQAGLLVVIMVSCSVVALLDRDSITQPERLQQLPLNGFRRLVHGGERLKEPSACYPRYVILAQPLRYLDRTATLSWPNRYVILAEHTP